MLVFHNTHNAQIANICGQNTRCIGKRLASANISCEIWMHPNPTPGSRIRKYKLHAQLQFVFENGLKNRKFYMHIYRSNLYALVL